MPIERESSPDRDSVEHEQRDDAAHAVDPMPATLGLNPWQPFTPQAAVRALRRRSDLQREIFLWMHRTFGAAFVRRVIEASETCSVADREPDAGAPASMSSLAESGDLAATGSPSASAAPAAAASTTTAASLSAAPAPTHEGSSGSGQASPSTGDRASPVASSASATTPAVARGVQEPQPEAARPAAEGEFTTLTGNAVTKTTAKEAAVLNAIRADQRRFDPAWLALAQRTLGVIDATGAMNTETLRAMRTRSGSASLGADGILDKAFLVTIAPGEPFLAVESGFADQAADGSARRPADLAAQAVGYASYAAYQAEWVPISFLGRSLGNPRAGSSGRGHLYLAARVGAAEAFLRQRHPGLNDEEVIKAIGWNGQGNASYHDEPETTKSHQHTMGLAIDIDPAHNPYIFNETATGLPHDRAMWWIAKFEEMFRVATRIYGGEPISPAILMDWSKKSSTEELIQRVQATSNAFRQYLELSKKSKDEILAALANAGYGADEADAALPEVHKAEELFHKGGGRQRATTITNIQEELLVALRDVAGLSWGGTEMSMRENGDFMHFDCRDTTFGHAIYAKKAPTKRS